MTDIFETTWEQLPDKLRERLALLKEHARSRQVKVVLQSTPENDVVFVQETTGRIAPADAAEWVRRLRAYAESHTPLSNDVDYSREMIYSEGVRDLD
jgi:hypothetical protein